MASYNRVILMGNLTRDPELRQSQKGTFIARAGLAVNERIPNGEGGWRDEVSFIDLVCFGKQAESFAKWFGKGRPCLVEGKLRQSSWEDRETGKKRSKLEVIVDRWHFVGGKGDASAAGPASTEAPAEAGFPSAGDFVPDDVPF